MKPIVTPKQMKKIIKGANADQRKTVSKVPPDRPAFHVDDKLKEASRRAAKAFEEEENYYLKNPIMQQASRETPAGDISNSYYPKEVHCHNCGLYETLLFAKGIPIQAHTCPDCELSWWDSNPMT